MRCGRLLKKNKNLTEEEEATGDIGSIWDHTAFDAISKLIVSLIQSPSRDQVSTDKLVEDFANRTDHILPGLMTSDEHATYPNAILKTYGEECSEELTTTAKPGSTPVLKPPEKLLYCTVRKSRSKGRVNEITQTIVFGTEEMLEEALERSPVSNTINTSFIERNNGTARHFNARKQRKTYCFSKRIIEHEAMSWLMVAHYNFCWTPRTLQVETVPGKYAQRSPAMAAGIADHVWSLLELLKRQIL